MRQSVETKRWFFTSDLSDLLNTFDGRGEFAHGLIHERRDPQTLHPGDRVLDLTSKRQEFLLQRGSLGYVTPALDAVSIEPRGET